MVLGACAMGEEQPPGDPDARVDARQAADASIPDARFAEIERYATDRTQSALTPAIVTSLRAATLRGPGLHESSFAKVGDSITDAVSFLYCASGGTVDLDGRTELQATIDAFKGNNPDPFQRNSVAATQNWRASDPLQGDPSPLTTEVLTMSPRFALVMFGTNDAVGQAATIHSFANALLTIVDQLLAGGTIPVLWTVPPNNDSTATDGWVPKYNAVVRGIAQGRQIPLVDFHREMVSLPNRGLDADGIHPSDNAPANCSFDADGLMKGYPLRNLLALQALDRLRHTLVLNEAAPDTPGPPLSGDGTSLAPYRISSLPFSDMADTSRSKQTQLAGYPSCDNGQNEGGPEILYQLDVTETVEVRALVFDSVGVDVDVHVLEGSPAPDTCRARNDLQTTHTLTPGTWYFSIDTFVPAGQSPAAGEFLFVLVRE
jgi:GDSL-like Lipase/Acylhydrolase family